MFVRSFALFLCAAWLIACGNSEEREQSEVDPLSTAVQGELGDCTVSLSCCNGSVVSCSGTNYQCSVGVSYVICNGNTSSCPIVPEPGLPCYFNGVWYQDGYVYGRGTTPPYVYCSSKVNGVCRNGPLDGTGCVGSGDCYATCDNGVWVN